MTGYLTEWKMGFFGELLLSESGLLGQRSEGSKTRFFGGFCLLCLPALGVSGLR
jgi:hypothetical protein